MADLLGATNRVAGYESIQNNRAQPAAGGGRPDPQVQNVSDPTRVNRADGKTEQQGANDALQSGALRYDSNFEAFLRQLQDAPDLSQLMSRVVMWLRASVSTPGMTAGVAKEVAAFLNMLQMDPTQMLQFLMNQIQGGNRFTGPLFELLRQAYRKIPEEGNKEAILKFARRYLDYSSAPHIEADIRRLLRQIPDYLPSKWRGHLADLADQLDKGLQNGTRDRNLQLLQNEILPYLSSYVEKSHNLGTVRTMIGMLMLDIARYENASEAGMLAAFRQLGGLGDILTGLNQLDNAALLKLLKENPFQKAAQNDSFSEQLSAAAARAMHGEFGPDVREAFQEILRSILINESVYMPLIHTMLPMEWNGKLLYSEIWVDPDAEEGNARRGNAQEVRFLLKMDIQTLGALEMTVDAKNDSVALRILGPEAVEQHAEMISEDLSQILVDHGLTGRSVQVNHLQRPLTLNEVFPGVFDRRRGVDVKI